MSGGRITLSYLRRGGRVQWHVMEAGISLESGWANRKKDAETKAALARRGIYARSKKCSVS